MSLLLLEAPQGLAAARAQLDAGHFDEVVLALSGKPLPADDQRAAVTILTDAGQGALRAKDSLLALQCAQMALKLEPRSAEALELGARAALAEHDVSAAERYADRWVEVSPEAAPRLFRAEIALGEADWAIAQRVLSGLAGERAAALRARATAEQARKQDGLRAMKEADALVGATAERVVREATPPAIAKHSQIIVYSIRQCPTCPGVVSSLKSERIEFVEKWVDTDLLAAEELLQKKRAQKLEDNTSVPWVDVRGKLVSGANWNMWRQFLATNAPFLRGGGPIDDSPQGTPDVIVYAFLPQDEFTTEKVRQFLNQHRIRFVEKNYAYEDVRAEFEEKVKRHRLVLGRPPYTDIQGTFVTGADPIVLKNALKAKRLLR